MSGSASRSGSRLKRRLTAASSTGPIHSAGGPSWGGLRRLASLRAEERPPAHQAGGGRDEGAPDEAQQGHQLARVGRLVLGLVEELLGHEAEQRRQAGHGDRGDGHRGGGQRHGPGEPAEEPQVTGPGLVVEGPDPEEQRRLVQGVDDAGRPSPPGRRARC